MNRLTDRSPNGKAIYKNATPEGLNENRRMVMEKCCRYEEMEEDGLLLCLPCKVGSYIYDIDFGRVTSCLVAGVSYGETFEDEEDNEMYEDEIVLHFVASGYSGRVSTSELGKTVFLSREEAEKALG